MGAFALWLVVAIARKENVLLAGEEDDEDSFVAAADGYSGISRLEEWEREETSLKEPSRGSCL